MKRHLKRINVPKTWDIKRQETKLITKPLPGQSSYELGLPLNVILRDYLKIAKTNHGVKYLLNHQEISVDHVKQKEPRFITGFMDTLSIPLLKQNYRMLINKKGKLYLASISETESTIKPCKIIGKSLIGKKIQINLYDGKNILVEKDSYKVGDSVLLELPSKKIKDTMKLDKGSFIFLFKGKHQGDSGIVEKIEKDMVTYKNKSNEVIQTKKMYAFVIGKEKPLIKIE